MAACHSDQRRRAKKHIFSASTRQKWSPPRSSRFTPNERALRITQQEPQLALQPVWNSVAKSRYLLSYPTFWAEVTHSEFWLQLLIDLQFNVRRVCFICMRVTWRALAGDYPLASLFHTEVEITLHLLTEQQSWTTDFVGSQNNITRLCMSLHDDEQVRRWRHSVKGSTLSQLFNPLNPELNPICYFLVLLGAHHFLHVSRIRVKSLTLRLLMSYIYIYMEHLFLMFLDHTQRRSTVGRTPLDEWLARRRDLCLTLHDTHNRQISMPPVGFEPKIIIRSLPFSPR